MPGSLIDHADQNLAIHSGWIQNQLDGMSCRNDPGLQLADSGLPSDTFNTVCRSRLDPIAAPGRIAAVRNHFAGSGRPFSWWLGPGDQPDNLDQLLIEAGLVRAETETAMAADLATLATHDVPVIPGIQVRRVWTADDLERFAALLAANWDPPDPSVLAFYRQASRILLTGECPLRLYLACEGDEPVGTVEVTVGGGVAGVYNVGTVAVHRGRGIGSQLVMAGLLGAAQDGISIGILQAAPAAQSLYQRLGFRSFGSYTEYKPRQPA